MGAVLIMGGPNLRDQLPVLKSVIKWFSKENIVTDSLVFRLHHQVTTFLILIGFVFTVIENYIDSKTITCYPGGQLAKYAHAYCWIHGAGYVRSHLQGVATGCYVDPEVVETNNEYSQITSYYLWLPYLLSFLFAMAKMPHSLWKRFFESNLLSSILGGMSGSDVKEQQADDQQQQQGQEGGEEENEEGENKGKKKQENNNGKKQKNPVIMARSFVQLRGVSRYNQYQFKFCLLEASNLLTRWLRYWRPTGSSTTSSGTTGRGLPTTSRSTGSTGVKGPGFTTPCASSSPQRSAASSGPAASTGAWSRSTISASSRTTSSTRSISSSSGYGGCFS